MIKRTRRRSRYEQRTSCDGPPSCSFLVLALAETYRDWLALEISSIGLDVVNCAKQFVRLVNLILSRRKWEGSVCLFVTHSATQWPTFQLYGATMSPFAIHNSRSTSSCVSGVCLFFFAVLGNIPFYYSFRGLASSPRRWERRILIGLYY